MEISFMSFHVEFKKEKWCGSESKGFVPFFQKCAYFVLECEVQERL
jgi:hypothetical protein